MAPRTVRIVQMIVVSALVTSAAAVEARPCGRIPADVAFSEATLIVKGTLVSTRPAQMPEGDSTSIIRIDRVLKGHAESSEVAVTHFLCETDNEYAFQRVGPVIAFINARNGSLVRGTAILPASNQSSGDADDPKTVVRNELMLSIAEPDMKTARAALGALAELDGRASIPILRRYSKGGDFGTRFRALAWLTRFGDADAFDELASGVSAPPFDREWPRSWRYNDDEEPLMTAYQDLRDSLGSYGEKRFGCSTAPQHETDRFVATMGRLAQLKNRMIHQAAMHALRGLNHRASFPILAAALDDPDTNVRYDAMFTLCMAMNANDLRCPATTLFRQDEQKYISRVRAWWKTQNVRPPPQ